MKAIIDSSNPRFIVIELGIFRLRQSIDRTINKWGVPEINHSSGSEYGRDTLKEILTTSAIIDLLFCILKEREGFVFTESVNDNNLIASKIAEHLSDMGITTEVR